MSLASLLAKFKSRGDSKSQQFVVIQADAVYLSDDADEAGAISKYPIDSSWEQTLEQALATINVSGRSIVAVIASQLYQSYQIDKPELPEEEWPNALPFLLKDLITERVTDIVADGYALTDGKKAQTYVLTKNVLNSINGAAEKAGADLARIIPEDEVWGYIQDEYPNFMLLHRSENSNFKIGAYVDRKSRFQRIIRGVAAPLTGTAMVDLQMDSLALELQRSTDYLSSQIRDVSINQLFLCCDGESQSELVSALSERLGIQVLAISEQDSVISGEELLKLAFSLPPTGVNLYPSHLKPKKELLTLTNVAISWLIIVLIMFGFYGYYSVQNGIQQAKLKQLTHEVSGLTSELQSLQKKVGNHKPTPSKLAAVERLKKELAGKKASLIAIQQYDTAEQAGYSGVMSSLSKLDSKDISVSSIILEKQTLSLSGLARTPSSVPKWVSQFKHEVDLVGRNFEKLILGRTEQDIVTFQLTTSLGDELPALPEQSKEEE